MGTGGYNGLPTFVPTTNQVEALATHAIVAGGIPNLSSHASLQDVYNTFCRSNPHTGAPSLMDLKHANHSSVIGNNRKRYSEYSNFYDAVQTLYKEQRGAAIGGVTCTINSVLEGLDEKRKARSWGVSTAVKKLCQNHKALS